MFLERRFLFDCLSPSTHVKRGFLMVSHVFRDEVPVQVFFSECNPPDYYILGHRNVMGTSYPPTAQEGLKQSIFLIDI